jgi:tetratricopeptide (TPR) repeat protein
MALVEAERWFATAVSRFRAGDHDNALIMAEKAVEADPAFSEASLELARLLQARERSVEAERILRQALFHAPNHPGLINNLGILLCQTRRAPEGLVWLRRAAAMAPRSTAAHFNLANALRAVGYFEEAAASYRATIGCDPRHIKAHTQLADCLIVLGRPLEAAQAFETATALRDVPDTAAAAPERTTEGKLRHDAEQIEYLARQGRLAPEHAGLGALYRQALAALPEAAASTPVDIPEAFRARLAPSYNRLWHRAAAPKLVTGALNPALDRQAIEADYAGRRPGMTYVDGLLRPEALASVRRFCLESSVWFAYGYANGYVGAMWEAGFWCPLLEQITEELRLALPGIFRDHTLRKIWAFKYDHRLSGIPIHADFAAVNVNFWVTPDEANLDPERGGLVVWDKEAPRNWDFQRFNADQSAIRNFLGQQGSRPFTVPHRQNRAVIFNSDLFHETDRIAFADGYENRRINITLLYGTRHG